MKYKKTLSCLFLICMALQLRCVSFRSYRITHFSPVYMSAKQFRNSFSVLTKQPLRRPGKLYLKDNFIFINEIRKGIHVIDNSNPRFPRKIAFIKIIGNQDLAIKGNMLYADSVIDLLVLDITSLKTNPSGIKIIKRIKDIFPYDPYRYLGISPLRGGFSNRWQREHHHFASIDRGKGIVVDWEINTKNKVRAEANCCMPGASMPTYAGMIKGGGGDSGVGGSLARFLVYNNYLYTIDSRRLKVFNLKEPGNPKLLTTADIGFDIETIFYYRDKLFIGAESGLYIFDVSHVPEKPQRLAMVPHARMRDPVAVEGNYAYVTLRDQGGLLIVYDISNPHNPRLARMFTMMRPYGLGIDNGRLFVCDAGGLVVLDANRLNHDKAFRWQMPTTVYEMGRISLPTQGLDVIPFADKLYIISETGFYQYDYANIRNITFLSSILIEPGK